MNSTREPADYALAAKDPALLVRQHEAAVSWGAVFAGGAGATAFALILLTLGTGLGLTSISPWSSGTSNAKAFGFAAVIWVCVTSILTSGLGGYLAGRLRNRWLGVDADEIHFRDTAHGFLSWAVATLLTAAILTSGASGIARVAGQAAATAAATGGPVSVGTMQRGNAELATNTWPLGYFIDSLFRMPAVASPAAPATAEGRNDASRAETARIFLNSAATGDQLSPEDIAYVSQLVAQRTGLTQAAAQARVVTTYTRLLRKIDALDAAAKDAADKARKVTIGASLWLFISLLMGAFTASLMATHGGRVRQL
ncbi:hypothetical protein B0G75_103281 [Paraburkholderia sp. BL18I3N2]|uniref:hypothetical protein n=1 Tax=Paraburkholderia sp. BL18I3N2 TaxID=1938799 RepID=UPI000D47958B|nr:hypothetical protein [Paraburkholderia sp. BL18I3N2]PRX33053.1 hypothetical protein B0G75_103281 [Paraburkholderia sp. BL18I3N2]